MKTVKQFIRFQELPVEWAGETLDKSLFHIKYQDGMLIVRINKSKMVMDYGHASDNEMTTEMMQELTRGILIWR